ncbi:MAG: hypothetical protein NTW21_38540 [Verrucomicrobia bacterium]|nr:hypothetical protein [Verrucomicrobiota bacterium]
MGYSGLDTLGLLKSSPQSGCGVPPQAVLAASRRQSPPPRLTISLLIRNTPYKPHLPQ